MRGKRGFTLIEVLIVIIILGILATLAIPQFTKMVKRAYLAEAWTGLGALKTAQEVYKMENGTSYALVGEVDKLDFEEPANTKFTYSIANGTSANYYNLLATGITDTATNGITAWIDSSGDKDHDLGN
jgi:type IV pilus assembly protein PilA